MAVFNYKARNRRGQLIEGVVDAVSEEMVANLLMEKSLTIIEIAQIDASAFNWQSLHFFRGVKSRDLVILFRQLSVMIESNLPIVKALRILVKQTRNRYLKTVLAAVTEDVDGGERLSAAMARFPDVFSDFFTSIIKSGETSGRLSEVLQYLADQQERDYDLQSRIRGAMIYPLFIITGLIVVGGILVAFVMPQLVGILADSGVELPLMTRILIGTTNFIAAYWLVLTLAIVGLGTGLTMYIRTDQGRRTFNRFKVSVPVFGGIFRQVYLIRITRSLSTLLRGGVPISRALSVTRDVIRWTVFEDVLSQTIRDVEEGNLIAQSLSASREVPPLVIQMISIGEESGELEKVLGKVTDFYSREVDNSVRNLSTLIEPIVMVVLGIAVGCFMAAVITPMWQLASAI